MKTHALFQNSRRVLQLVTALDRRSNIILKRNMCNILCQISVIKVSLQLIAVTISCVHFAGSPQFNPHSGHKDYTPGQGGPNSNLTFIALNLH